MTRNNLGHTRFTGDTEHESDHDDVSLNNRDSLFVAITMREQIRQKVTQVSNHSLNAAADSIDITVDTILYSPDSLKIVALVVVFVPKAGEGGPAINPDENAYYSSIAMIGYRSVSTEPWILYPYGKYEAYYSTYLDVAKRIRRYYFTQLADDGEYGVDDSGEFVAEKFGFNLGDPEFWSRSLIWRKGARIPGRYNFETRGNVKPGYTDPLIVLPEIVYPDSLLLQFGAPR